jgi:hypothetical protein
MIERYYFKCEWCERPFACECPREDVEAVRKANCPLCGEAQVRVMGRVEKSNIVRGGVKAACDLRCTNSVGPRCDCRCNCENHGTHKLVSFDKIVGKLAVVNKDLLNDNEDYLARIKRMAAAKNSIKVKVITFLNYKYRDAIAAVKQHGYNYEMWHKYDIYRKTLQKIDKIEDLKSIQRKINSLTHLIPTIGDTLQYLEALSAKKEQEVVA